jgi:hypothetical protein
MIFFTDQNMKLNSKKLVFSIINIVLLLFSTGLVSFSQEKNPLQPGIDLFNTGKFDQSLPFFRKIIKTRPGDPKANFYFGASFIELNQFPDSAYHSLNYASQEEGLGKSFYYLGILNHHAGDWNEAIKCYNKFKNVTGKNESDSLKIDDLISRCFNRIRLTSVTSNSGKEEIVVPQIPVSQKDSLKTDIKIKQENQSPKDTIISTNEKILNVWVESGSENIRKDTISVPATIKTEIVPDSAKVEKIKTAAEIIPATQDTVKHIVKEPSGAVTVIRDTLNSQPIKDGIPIPVQKNQIQEQEKPDLQPDTGKVSKPYEVLNADTVKITTPVKEITDIYIEFQINNEITYLRTSHFRTDKGLQLFTEGSKAKVKLDSLLAVLNILRKQYDTTINPSEKEKTGQNIISTEKESMSLDAEVTNLFLQARNFENEYWSVKTPDEVYNFKIKTDSIRKSMITANKNLTAQIDSATLIIPESNMRKDYPVKKPKQGQKEIEVITYKVQLGSWKGNPSATFQSLIKKLSMLRKIENFKDEKGYTIYTTGNLTNYGDAEEMQKQVKLEGIKNATIIAFKNGKKITLQEVLNNSVQK